VSEMLLFYVSVEAGSVRLLDMGVTYKVSYPETKNKIMQ